MWNTRTGTSCSPMSPSSIASSGRASNVSITLILPYQALKGFAVVRVQQTQQRARASLCQRVVSCHWLAANDAGQRHLDFASVSHRIVTCEREGVLIWQRHILRCSPEGAGEILHPFSETCPVEPVPQRGSPLADDRDVPSAQCGQHTRVVRIGRKCRVEV